MPKGIKCGSTGVMKYYCTDHCLLDSCHTTFDMNYCNCKNNVITKKTSFTEISLSAEDFSTQLIYQIFVNNKNYG